MAERILVIDDVAEIRALIKRVLSGGGYEVDVAATLAEARRMDPGGYAAVVVDAHLGAERGVDLVEELRAQDPAAVSRCVLITGGDVDALPDGLALLAKPFGPAELLGAVRTLSPAGARTSPDRRAGARPDSSGSITATGATTARVAPDGPLPRPAPAQVWPLLALVRRLRSRERRELVDFLHDGPIQDLTAGILEGQLMRRSVPPGPAPRFDAVLRQLDAAAGSLRWLVDGDWPFSQTEIRLADMLRQRTAWLLAAPATVDLDAASAGLGVSGAAGIADVVELMLLGTASAGCPLRAHVAVRATPDLTRLELTLTPAGRDDQTIGDPAPARAALDELAGALGITAQGEFEARRWQLRISLPVRLVGSIRP